jgi:membrane-associated phospholipid phosphatase
MPPPQPLSSRQRTAARWISIVGHPFVFGLAFAGLGAVRTLSPGRAALVIALIGAGGLLPLAFFVRREVLRGRFSDHDVSERTHRGRLFRAAFLLLGAILAVLLAAGAPRPVLAGVAAALGLLVAAALLNLWIKVSLHTAFAFFFAVSLLPLAPRIAGVAVALAVAVGWSRLALERHTVPEVLLGGGLGGTIGWLFLAGLERL